WTPPSAFDARAAWSGTFPEQPGLALRVEAAAWRGRPIYFEVIGPWATPERGTALQRDNPMLRWTIHIIWVAVFLLGGMLTWRNWRQGRSDRRGAFRLTVFVFLAHIVTVMVGSGVIVNSLAHIYVPTSQVFIAYLGLEPYVRRRWPAVLTSWSRVLAGRFRDPLVGRDVLIGILIGITSNLIRLPFMNISPSTFTFSLNNETLLKVLSSARLAAGNLVLIVGLAVAAALIYLFALFLLRLLARRDWMAVGLFALLIGVGLGAGNWQVLAMSVLANGLIAVAMTRYGLVSMVVALFALYTLSVFPVTLNFSVWYAGIGLAPLVAVLSLAVFAFYTSLGGKKVFQGSLLED
ncbi:MAG TPA: hypothetical protein VG324_25000, partial [Blastocatellia bacterium]|nr:hypothetical protein [Blastocatellia bacterium]